MHLFKWGCHSLTQWVTVMKFQDQTRKITSIIWDWFALDKFGLVKFCLVCGPAVVL